MYRRYKKHISIICIIIFCFISICIINSINKTKKVEKAAITSMAYLIKEIKIIGDINTKIHNKDVDNIKKDKEKKFKRSASIAKPLPVVETITEDIEDEVPEVLSLGNFKLTAYCSCNICCGRWANGITASGTVAVANRTIAVDTSVIPLGTEVIIDGNTYVAEDTGGAINGNSIDIYMNSHYNALQWGVRYSEVFIVND